MASKEATRRNEEISNLLSQLIKSLTGFDESNVNFKLITEFANAQVNCDRYLSTNSHAVRKKLDGVYEKFKLSNYGKYADLLRKNVEFFTEHPACNSHTEKDCQWGMIAFMLEVAYNPVGGLKHRLMNNSDIFESVSLGEEDLNETLEKKIVKELREADVVGVDFKAEDSSLSEWSDSDEDDAIENDRDNQKQPSIEIPTVQQKKPPILPKPISIVTKLEPPKRVPIYHEYDSSSAGKNLIENVQSEWWKNKKYISVPNSKYQSASFCEYWNQLLARVSYNVIKTAEISTTSEHCLLREIFWMFVKPVNAKFFKVENERIVINANVSIASVTVKGLKSFLKVFTQKMTIMYVLRQFCQKVLQGDAKKIRKAPHTMEAYAAELARCLDLITHSILEKEKIVMSQEPGIVSSVLELFNHLQPQFKLLDYLWDIHRFSVIDWHKYQNHVCSAHLLAGLFLRIRKSSSSEKAALVSSLYLSTIRVYLSLVDIWWSDGRLDDFRQEFLIQTCIDDTDQIRDYVPRLNFKDMSISPNRMKLIEKDPVICMLMRHSLNAGDTLSVLARLDRMNDIKSKSSTTTDMYDVFMETVLSEIEKFRTNAVEENALTMSYLDPMKSIQISNNMTDSMMSSVSVNDFSEKNNKILEFKDEVMEMGNEILLLACKESLNLVENDVETTNEPLLFEKFKSTSNLILPYDNIILKTISKMLNAKLAIADNLVIKIYKEEFQLMSHLNNLRNVYLLEASDLMFEFYTALFTDIEAGKDWMDPYILTVQLSSALSGRMPDAASLFAVEIGSETHCFTTKVLDAIDEISLSYLVDLNLQTVINHKSLSRYNQVFRFFLKIKWAIWTLESLRFPDPFKNRRPYASLTPLDVTMRRLIIVRIWVIYIFQCLHSHLVQQVMVALQSQLDERIDKAKNLSELISAHEAYISTVYGDCFLKPEDSLIRESIKQLLNLVYIVRDEWNSVCTIMELEEQGVSDDAISIDIHIQEIEETYISCHRNLVDMLNKEIHKKGKQHLAELHSAFNCVLCQYRPIFVSIPHPRNGLPKMESKLLPLPVLPDTNFQGPLIQTYLILDESIVVPLRPVVWQFSKICLIEQNDLYEPVKGKGEATTSAVIRASVIIDR
uniref:CSON012437 protein n=1 Tax=Culicoides sonorensis TaxID=179676 RepID=A0A336KQ99_CULSO